MANHREVLDDPIFSDESLAMVSHFGAFKAEHGQHSLNNFGVQTPEPAPSWIQLAVSLVQLGAR